MKKQCAGNYEEIKDIKIHDHPVWLKVKPNRGRIGYYQKGKVGSWIITDLENLKPMLKDQEKDPKTNWKNAFATSKNIVEAFEKAIWNDGKHDLTPYKKAPEANDDADADDAKKPTDKKEGGDGKEGEGEGDGKKGDAKKETGNGDAPVKIVVEFR